jgi:hypothetical protein
MRVYGKRMRPRDTQRERLYRWERDFHVGQSPLTLKQVEKLVAKVARHYGAVAPRVKDGRGRSNAGWIVGQYALTLPKWARIQVVALHECAHWITDRLHTRNVAIHGREFLATFMYLLAKFGGLSLAELTASARNAGLDFSSPAACRPAGGRRILDRPYVDPGEDTETS